MKPSEILKAAKAKIATPDAWTQGELARDSAGEWCGYYDPDAKCFCSLGALLISARSPALTEAIKYLEKVIPAYTVLEFNDTHTHAEVMAKWDEAIALAEKDEANAS
jgi:hypothetical protein